MKSTCQDCDRSDAELFIVAADLGEGAFLAVLCEVCWHRRKYRAHLEQRLGLHRRRNIVEDALAGDCILIVDSDNATNV